MNAIDIKIGDNSNPSFNTRPNVASPNTPESYPEFCLISNNQPQTTLARSYQTQSTKPQTSSPSNHIKYRIILPCHPQLQPPE